MIVRYVEYLHPGLLFSENSYVKFPEGGLTGKRPHTFGYRLVEREEVEGESGELTGEWKVCSPWTMHGREETVEEIRERADPNERILLSNMECNGYKRVCRTEYGQAIPLKDDDVVVGDGGGEDE
jgi:hypothetical protein